MRYSRQLFLDLSWSQVLPVHWRRLPYVNYIYNKIELGIRVEVVISI